jgi:DUF1365 family protein
MQSALYIGTVRHRRYAPRPHGFRYRMFMMYLDLDELPGLFDRFWLWSARRPALARFDRRAYFGDPALPLKTAVADLVEARTGRRPQGPIRLLTHLRYFGHGFNPVSFYYCFDAEGKTVETIVAEVSNTPWHERHCYVLDARDAAGAPRLRRHALRKAFHVSPFMPMEQDYAWAFTVPGAALNVHMENLEAGRRVFDATLVLRRRPITSRALAGALIAFPAMTLQVVAAIYWQALRLWLKGIPFHSHPTHHQTTGETQS